MVMIETIDFTFASAPKTGCQWMRDVIRRCYPDHTLHGNNGLHEPGRIDGKMSYTFVRDPADWLRSYYQNITSIVGNPTVDMFQFVIPTDKRTRKGLIEFIEAYLMEMPADSIASAFTSYDADIMFPIEDMPGPLEKRLEIPLRGMKRHETKHPLKVPVELRQEIYRHEPGLDAIWNYSGRSRQATTG